MIMAAIDYQRLDDAANALTGPMMLPRTRRRNAGDTVSSVVSPGQALPNSISALRSKAAGLYDQGAGLFNSDPDTSELQSFAKARGQDGDAAMMTALAAQYAGENFAPVQEQLLKKAMAAREPMKMGSGMLTGEGKYIKDPFAAQDKRAEFLLSQAKAYEQMAATAETTQERQQAQRAQELFMNEFRQQQLQDQRENAGAMQGIARDGLDLRKDMFDFRKEAAGNKSDPGNYTLEGYTPKNERIVTNTKTGQSFVMGQGNDGGPSYTAYMGPMIPKATYEKEVGGATEALASANRSDAIISMVEKNPEAFGLTANVLSKLPGAMQGRVSAALLDPKTMEVRSNVLRQAAQEINQLYGAALSAGENARASTFIPDATDPPALVIQKLKAARDWAHSNATKHGPAITRAAETRIGSPAAGDDAGDPLGVRRK